MKDKLREIGLETLRLILRKPEMNDWKKIYEIIDLPVIKNFFMPYPLKKKHVKYWIKDAIKDFGMNSYKFIIELKKEKLIIGMIELKDIHNKDKISETSIWIGKKYFKKGYGTEAKIALNEFAFNKLKVRKLRSETMESNLRSNLLQKKFGYFLEGTKRREHFNPVIKKYVNMNVYGLFKEDWKKNLPKLKRYIR
jgi:RimJ/RimL family protein N-acetyltransferase